MRLRLLSRSPLTYWVAVGALALVTTLAISQLLGRARTEAARYGSPRSVLVATRDLMAGAQLKAAGPAAAKLGKGDTVDVLATFDPATSAAAGKDPTFPVAVGASVIDVAGEAVTIAVDPEEAKRVAFASAHGAVTVVLSSPVR